MKAFIPEFPKSTGSPQPATGGRALVPLGQTLPLTAGDIAKILGDCVSPEEMGAACAAYDKTVAHQDPDHDATGDILDIHG